MPVAVVIFSIVSPSPLLFSIWLYFKQQWHQPFSS
jgi:hypothetical protein